MAEAVVGSLILKISAALAAEAANTLSTISKEEASLLLSVRSDMRDIKSELEMMQAFIRHADHLSEGDHPASVWVNQVREAAHDIEDIIDEFTYFVGDKRKSGIWSSVAKTLRLSRNISSRHGIAKQLQEIKSKIKGISDRRIRYDVKGPGEGPSNNDAREKQLFRADYSRFLQEDFDVVGVENSKKHLIDWLTEEEAERKEISVWGMGGLGKTTLTARVYMSEETVKHFDCRAWITVSKTYEIDDVLRSIIKELFNEKEEMIPQNIGVMSTGSLTHAIRRYLQPKRYLIVFDDVWNVDVRDKICVALPKNKCKSRLMFTTRNHEIASSLASPNRVFQLQSLHYDQAWDLFCKNAFQGDLQGICPPELKDSATTIVKKCDGLPLAIVTLAGVMCSKEKSTTQWNSVTNSLNWMISNNQQLEKISNILMLSFHDLPHYLKTCFLYCSAFPEDYPIKRKRIIRLWVAEGFVEARKGMTMEDTAEEYLNELVHRSMLHVARANTWGRIKEFRMHDVVREVAICMSKKQNFCMMLEEQPTATARRLSILKANNTVHTALGKMPHLRSLLVFATDDSISITLNKMAELGFRLLRVLDLQGAPIDSLPDAVNNLFNLSYLNLRRTKVKVLPNSLGRLQNLQTLDLQFSGVEELPSGIQLRSLRHLFSTVSVGGGLRGLKDLQTLKGIISSGEVVEQVGELTQLRSFAITKVMESDGATLCSSIKRMRFLHHLDVQAVDEGEGSLELESLGPPPSLQKLSLKGRLQRLPRWFRSLTNLKVLILRSSGLREDPLHFLQKLPNLVYLELRKAYNGKKLNFQKNAFPSLKTLLFFELNQLNQITIEGGAMPSLQRLNLVRCGELKMLPLGIDCLATLHQLYLVFMPEELLERMREQGDDRPKIRQIPIVKHIAWRKGKCVEEFFS
ncbi:Disease resistance protein RPM1 [Acorus calamus]|uniref:Disease resistance protein RPM1 n=1 Tax=Acorus calamus TaxID=4465 RepID=A0AAV9ETE7_ACOCL|nr:Disease resistance protein RPM1 [Acorus calamus]